jgi:hypothetical protein
MESIHILFLVAALFTKHAVVDFPMQVPYHYLNKGTYGHPGGILHAAFHGIATALVFWVVVDPHTAVWMGILDMVFHYHIDWAKMNLNKKLGYGPTTHEQFWWLLGLDQWLHAMTYVGLIWLVM